MGKVSALLPICQRTNERIGQQLNKRFRCEHHPDPLIFLDRPTDPFSASIVSSTYFFQDDRSLLHLGIHFFQGPIDRPVARHTQNPTELSGMPNEIISSSKNFRIGTVFRQKFVGVIDGHAGILNMVEVVRDDRDYESLWIISLFEPTSNLPTVVKSMLSRNKATKTMKRMRTRDERHFCQKSLTVCTLW